MKKWILVSLALAMGSPLLAQRVQQAAPQQPSAPASTAPLTPRNQPNTGVVPPNAQPPATTAGATAPATNQLSATATNQFGVTNPLTPTGLPNFTQTNTTSIAATQTINFSVTNTLSRMAPAQATNVIHVQFSLTALQNMALTLGGAQNVTDVVQQNPQVQQQLQQISAQITSLAQGPVKPSNEITARLARDLLRAFAPARLAPDRLLVLAIVINQAANSGSLTGPQVEDSINTAQSTLQTSGVPLALTHPVTCDLHSIAFELQPNLAR